MNLNFWSDPVNFISHWLSGLFLGWGMAPDLVNFLMILLGVIVLGMGPLLFTIFLIWYERKILGRVQDRYGPNRVGPWGIIQPIADMLKIFAKEYVTPQGAEKIPYNLAPILVVASVLMLWAVMPLAKGVIGVDLNVGVLYLLAAGGIGALGFILAGWSSNNKYALLGSFRSVAVLISYEVPMVLSLLIPVLLSRSMGMNEIVEAQHSGFWFVFVVPVAAFIYFTACIAEVNRSPFDLIEGESEIVAGFNVEYSGLKFGMFYVGEFLHAFTVSMLFTALFLGGWQGPGADQYPILGFIYFFIKAWIAYFITLIIRGTLPRFRIDQMMDVNWKLLTPTALVVVMGTALVDKLLQTSPLLVRGLGLLAVNLVVGVAVMEFLRRAARRRRVALSQTLNEKARALPETPSAQAPSGANS